MDVLEIREDKQCNNTPLFSRHLPAGYVVGYEKTNNREAESIARRRECFKAWTGLGTNDDMSICNYETSLVTAIGENITDLHQSSISMIIGSRRSFLSFSVMYGGPTSCCSISHWIRRLAEEERPKEKDEEAKSRKL
ncbi:hypothetical protein YC2023_099198 [Brassica napus]